MTVTVYLTAWFRQFVSDKKLIKVDIQECDTIIALMQRLKIPTDEIGLVTLNGKRVNLEHLLSDADKVEIYPYIIGG